MQILSDHKILQELGQEVQQCFHPVNVCENSELISSAVKHSSTTNVLVQNTTNIHRQHICLSLHYHNTEHTYISDEQHPASQLHLPYISDENIC